MDSDSVVNRGPLNACMNEYTSTRLATCSLTNNRQSGSPTQTCVFTCITLKLYDHFSCLYIASHLTHIDSWLSIYNRSAVLSGPKYARTCPVFFPSNSRALFFHSARKSTPQRPRTGSSPAYRYVPFLRRCTLLAVRKKRAANS